MVRESGEKLEEIGSKRPVRGTGLTDFFSSRGRHTRCSRDWSSDVCSSDLLSFLGQMITDWLGEKGTLVKLSGSYRGMNKVHEDIICNGKVTKKYAEEGRNCARVEIWAGNPQGEKTVTGTAVVTLPSRENT